MQPILSHIKQSYQRSGHLDLQQIMQHALLALPEAEEYDRAQLLYETVAANVTALELRTALMNLLAVFLPQGGYGHGAVDAALRVLAETQGRYQGVTRALHPFGNIGESVHTYPLVYHVVATPALPLAPENLIVLGDVQDMERGIVLLSSAMLADSPQLSARYPYLPVQAVSPGSVTPDLVVEVWDGVEQLTTLHFCTIWRGMQRSVQPGTWERVSYQTAQLALQYNTTRVFLCPYCLHLHRNTCLIAPHAEQLQLALVE